VAQAFQLLCKLYVDVWSCDLALRSQQTHSVGLCWARLDQEEVAALFVVAFCVDHEVVERRSSGINGDACGNKNKRKY